MSEALRHVHFVAICGVGMGSLAGLVRARGAKVTGSDDQLYPPMSTALERWGIPVHQGFRAEHVVAGSPDVGPAFWSAAAWSPTSSSARLAGSSRAARDI